MSDEFKKSRFFLSVASNAQYDEDTVFNENNIIHFLAECEEYISLLITYMSMQQEKEDAATSAICLEKMNVKEFDKRQLNIEPPNSHDINLMNEDAETEDDLTTDPRQLYKKFEDIQARNNDLQNL